MSSVSCVRLAAVNRQELSDLLKNNLKIWYWKNITGHVCGYMLTVTPNARCLARCQKETLFEG